MSEVSQLRFYSIGTVAANKPLDSMDIEVTPIEDQPMLDGEITDDANQTEAKAKDVEGAAYQTEVPSAASIKATWLPISNSNRMTAPDVRRGETVVLYRFADQDKFWWNTLRNDMHLRKLETVVWGISATRDENAKSDATSMYYLEFSSHKKLIHLHTSKKDGEPYEYDIQINTKEGFIQIQDDDGQVITLDSRERQIRMENRDGSFYDMNKTKIHIHADDEIKLSTKSYILESDTMDTTASSSAIHKTPTNTIEAQSLHKGNIGILGNMTQAGAGGGAGTAEFTGTVRVTEDVIAANVSLVHHTHNENDGGGDTDPPNPG